MRYTLLFFLCIWMFTLNAQNENPKYSLYLVGDAGKVTQGQQNAFSILKSQLQASGENSGIIFLGDNIYPVGMPSEDSPKRGYAEKAIDSQIDLVRNYDGNVFFIPGNHDWAQGKSYGWSHLTNQEKYIESQLDSSDVFLPSDGCPGPVEVPINEELTLIIVDFQWFLHPWDKPGKEKGGCEATGILEAIQMLDDVIQRNEDKKIVVASHHPMYTYGSHGGTARFKDHIFPLTVLSHNLYIPLPGIGSIYPMFRKVFGNIQDVSHPKYRAIRNAFVSTFEKHPNLIHAAGHEHSLQYSYKDSVHYIVSGSGAKTTFVKKKKYAEYAESVYGFARVDFYENGQVNVSYWHPKGNSTEPVESFSKELYNQPFVPKTPEEYKAIDFTDSTVNVKASSQYQASKFRRRWLGTNYRKEWTEEIETPVFDIGKEHGGLKIVQRGGGQQTKSLRLEAENGKQYVLRSIEKYPENAVPAFLRRTFAADLVQDQISAAHPYGALVVPYLAEAAKIYHTNPKLVFIPEDPRLGQYEADFANTLALYEERVSGNWEDADFFGNSKKIISTTKVLSKLTEDNDDKIDAEFVIKSRLFDLFISDWDRHDDQWRWASFEDPDGKGKLYRPIPRDRDQAFFVNEGVLPKIWSKKWALPKFEGFDYNVRWASGLMFNARYFDRSFLTEPSEEVWARVAEELQANITDEVIENAIKKWPKNIFDIHGQEVIDKLKSRRKGLRQYAIDHYKFLARQVSVLGSDKKEKFEVDRLENGDVQVKVYKISKGGDKKHKMYDRLFKYGETKEIRLYGMAGKDEFKIKGEANKSIKIRVIGGAGKDELDDDSAVKGWSKKTIFYDTPTGNELKFNDESKDKTSDKADVNSYDRKSFRYNVLAPLVTANINPDDGLFLGGGFIYTAHGFRKEPFKSRHLILGSYAINTASYNFKYKGDFTQVIGNWDLNLLLDVKQPNFVNNFFGLGNESEFDTDIDDQVNVNRAINFYRIRFQDVSTSIGISKKFSQHGRISLGYNFRSVEVERPDSDDQRFISQYAIDNPDIPIFGPYRNFMGGTIGLTFDKRNNTKLTTAGVLWDNNLSYTKGVKDSDASFGSINSELSFYYTFRLPSKLTIATRFGWGTNLGDDFEFYQSQILGGKDQLRGFRKTRFYGESKAYNNIEFRLKLFSLSTYLFPASIGIMAFNDLGRVWQEGENSSTWHHGAGGGLWFAPFNMAVISTEVGTSTEETLFYLRLGFLF